jgi:hypothetical protein
VCSLPFGLRCSVVGSALSMSSGAAANAAADAVVVTAYITGNQRPVQLTVNVNNTVGVAAVSAADQKALTDAARGERDRSERKARDAMLWAAYDARMAVIEAAHVQPQTRCRFLAIVLSASVPVLLFCAWSTLSLTRPPAASLPRRCALRIPHSPLR